MTSSRWWWWYRLSRRRKKDGVGVRVVVGIYKHTQLLYMLAWANVAN